MDMSQEENLPMTGKSQPFIKEEVLSGIYNVCMKPKLLSFSNQNLLIHDLRFYYKFSGHLPMYTSTIF